VRPSVILNYPSGNPDLFCGARSCILRRPGVRNVGRILELLVGKGSDCGGENKIAFVCIHNEFKVFWGIRVENGGRPGIRRCGLAKLIQVMVDRDRA
jgi:hypothetical protein